jgi:RNA polymerase sigma-70 factor (ECF subfamily)
LARYEALVGESGVAVAHYLYGMIGDQDTADDLAQDVFLSAWRNLDSLRDPAAARSWLFAIAANIARRHLRRSGRFGWLPLRVLDDEVPRHLSPDLNDDAFGLERAMGVLSGDDRAILLLVGTADLTLPEAATVLGISPEAAKKRWQRACVRFRAAFDGAVQQTTTSGEPA